MGDIPAWLRHMGSRLRAVTQVFSMGDAGECNAVEGDGEQLGHHDHDGEMGNGVAENHEVCFGHVEGFYPEQGNPVYTALHKFLYKFSFSSLCLEEVNDTGKAGKFFSFSLVAGAEEGLTVHPDRKINRDLDRSFNVAYMAPGAGTISSQDHLGPPPDTGGPTVPLH